MPNLDLDSRRMTLSELRAGHEAEIAEVSDHDSALLHDLGQLGMYPQVRVCVVAKAVFPGLLTVEIGGRKHRLRPDAARHIWVRNVRAIQPATKSNELKPRGRRATVK